MNMGSRGSGESPNVHDAKMCCGFCHTVVSFLTQGRILDPYQEICNFVNN